MTNVLDDLSCRIEQHQLLDQKTDAGSDFPEFLLDHGERVDNRRCIKQTLKHDFPDVLSITKIDVEGRQQQRHPEGKQVELHQVDRKPKHVNGKLHARQNTGDNHDTKVDRHADERIDRRRDDDDVLGKVDFPQQVAACSNGAEAHRSGLGEEVPHADAKQQNQRKGIGPVRKTEELYEHDVHDAKKHQGFENRPRDAQERPLVAQQEIGFHKLPQDDEGLAVAFFQFGKQKVSDLTNQTRD